MPATWLADVLRAAGLSVDESLVPDWKQRGHTDGPTMDNPVGVLGHHTAGGASGDLPSLATVRDGRPDLAGPLSNLMLSRAGVWVPIAAGRCWHAGAADNRAAWPWVPNGDANGYLLGIEAESSGTGDWTPQQLATYPAGVAALLAHLGAGPDRFIGHLEWAPSRKVDPAGWPGGMNGFRQSVAAPPQEDDMFEPSDALRLTRIENAVGALIGVAGRPVEVEARLDVRLDTLTALVQQLTTAVAQLQGGSTANVKAIADQLTVVPKP